MLFYIQSFYNIHSLWMLLTRIVIDMILSGRFKLFIFTFQGVPGEAGAAGSTGPRVSWHSSPLVWLTDCQACRWLSLCRRSGRARFPRRERSCRPSGSAGTSRSPWNSRNWRTQGESSVWSNGKWQMGFWECMSRFLIQQQHVNVSIWSSPVWIYSKKYWLRQTGLYLYDITSW